MLPLAAAKALSGLVLNTLGGKTVPVDNVGDAVEVTGRNDVWPTVGTVVVTVGVTGTDATVGANVGVDNADGAMDGVVVGTPVGATVAKVATCSAEIRPDVSP